MESTATEAPSAPASTDSSDVSATVAAMAGIWALRGTPHPAWIGLLLVLLALACLAARWLRPRAAGRSLLVPGFFVAFAALGGVVLADGEVWPLELGLVAVQLHRRVVRRSRRDDLISLLLAAAMIANAAARAPFAGPLLISLSAFVPASLSALTAGLRFRFRAHFAVVLGVVLFALGLLRWSAKRQPTEPQPFELSVVATGFVRPTDVQFPPAVSDRAVVLGQDGEAWVVRVADGSKKTWFRSNVHHEMECGLLGLAFHPRFPSDGRFYVDQCIRRGTQTFLQVVEWTAPQGLDAPPFAGRVILEIEKPWDNHNGGQLRFGKDGFLYVGIGDGGSISDPDNRAQNLGTWFGKLLRIDPNRAENGRQYAIPPDNPFVGQQGALPEIWAYGLRNPWRFDFLPDGRVILGDVGDESWEEIDVVAAGNNLGWSIREGRHCFKPRENCVTQNLVEPIYEYGRNEGVSVTGGVMYYGKAIPELYGRFLFADFGRASFRAVDLEGKVVKFPRIATVATAFGRDARGEVYILDYASTKLLRLDKVPLSSWMAIFGRRR